MQVARAELRASVVQLSRHHSVEEMKTEVIHRMIQPNFLCSSMGITALVIPYNALMHHFLHSSDHWSILEEEFGYYSNGG